MKKPIYLDYNGTTPLAPEVREAIQPFMEEHFGNPSSSHWYGEEPKRAVATDNRLAKDVPRTFSFSWKENPVRGEALMEITFRYHLLDEARRKRIDFQNTEAISYILYPYNSEIIMINKDTSVQVTQNDASDFT